MSEITEHKAYYWLSLSGMTAKKINAALSVYSCLELWERVGKDKHLEAALGEKHYKELIKYKNTDYLDSELFIIKHKNIRILTLAHADYPEALRQREVSPPPVLYYKGDLSVLKKPCIAIVGTRAASPYGKEVAQAFGHYFALNRITVVSGMATGIDEYAHRAALEFNATVAVLGGGFDNVSASSQNIFNKIVESGNLVLTEYPPQFIPTKYSFPERNRIISGLSRAVVVIEAGEQSGALITADYALEQGREIYAVPGNILNPKSAGCNALIKNGNAAFITSPDDVLSDLGLFLPENDKKEAYILLDIYEEKLYNLLKGGQAHFDDLVNKAQMPPNEVMSLLFNLELKGIIKKLPANFYKVIS